MPRAATKANERAASEPATDSAAKVQEVDRGRAAGAGAMTVTEVDDDDDGDGTVIDKDADDDDDDGRSGSGDEDPATCADNTASTSRKLSTYPQAWYAMSAADIDW